MTALILPFANSEMMSLFLEEVSKDFVDYLVIMLVDQAGWHRSKELRVPKNIRLLPQPSYSPELNPVEHIWEDLKEKELANKAHKSLNEVIEDLCIGVQRLIDNPEYLKSLTNFAYLNIVI